MSTVAVSGFGQHTAFVLYFRYVTPAIKGRWYPSLPEALVSALQAGQAERIGGDIVVREYVRIEQQPSYRCDR